MRIKKSTFPGCCGIQVLWDFGNTIISLGDNKKDITISTISTVINDILLKGTKQSWEPIAYIPPVPIPSAMTLITLNQTQHTKMHKMMIRKGFKLIDKGWNINHNNMNYLYSLHLEKGQIKYENLK